MDQLQVVWNAYDFVGRLQMLMECGQSMKQAGVYATKAWCELPETITEMLRVNELQKKAS